MVPIKIGTRICSNMLIDSHLILVGAGYWCRIVYFNWIFAGHQNHDLKKFSLMLHHT